MSKDFIRSEAIRHRQNLQIDPAWADQAAENFTAKISVTGGQTVSLYYPRGKEMDTLPLAEALWQKGISCALPVMQDEERALRFAKWSRETTLAEGAFGIPAPAQPEFIEPDIVLVPLLVFDQQGHRLGYGKGYYDATLKELRAKKPVVAVGFAYAEQSCLFALPREDHDEKLDFVVTPQRVFDFRT